MRENRLSESQLFFQLILIYTQEICSCVWAIWLYILKDRNSHLNTCGCITGPLSVSWTTFERQSFSHPAVSTAWLGIADNSSLDKPRGLSVRYIWIKESVLGGEKERERKKNLTPFGTSFLPLLYNALQHGAWQQRGSSKATLLLGYSQQEKQEEVHEAEWMHFFSWLWFLLNIFSCK